MKKEEGEEEGSEGGLWNWRRTKKEQVDEEDCEGGGR